MRNEANKNGGIANITNNDDNSHKGANMAKSVESTDNHTVSAEVSGTDVNQDQPSRNGAEEKKRGPYKGNYSHGVTPDADHIKTILEYDKALKRLKLRRNYLVGEHEEIISRYNLESDIGIRAQLMKDEAAKAKQIKAVDDVRKKLEGIRDEIEKVERDNQANPTFSKFETEDVD